LLYEWSDDDGFIIKPKRIRIFKYTEEIWHHLGNHTKPGQIYDKKGNLYLSSIEDYLAMLNKEKHAMIKQTTKWLVLYQRNVGNKLQFPLKPNGSLDHIEVFISQKI
jgi:phosphoribosylformylglycinamidine (FGAM) synthase-like amidotransferase family enzyme